MSKKTFDCTDCTKKFKTEAGLNSHINNVHAEKEEPSNELMDQAVVSEPTIEEPVEEIQVLDEVAEGEPIDSDEVQPLVEDKGESAPIELNDEPPEYVGENLDDETVVPEPIQAPEPEDEHSEDEAEKGNTDSSEDNDGEEDDSEEPTVSKLTADERGRLQYKKDKLVSAISMSKDAEGKHNLEMELKALNKKLDA